MAVVHESKPAREYGVHTPRSNHAPSAAQEPSEADPAEPCGRAAAERRRVRTRRRLLRGSQPGEWFGIEGAMRETLWLTRVGNSVLQVGAAHNVRRWFCNPEKKQKIARAGSTLFAAANRFQGNSRIRTTITVGQKRTEQSSNPSRLTDHRTRRAFWCVCSRTHVCCAREM